MSNDRISRIKIASASRRFPSIILPFPHHDIRNSSCHCICFGKVDIPFFREATWYELQREFQDRKHHGDFSGCVTIGFLDGSSAPGFLCPVLVSTYGVSSGKVELAGNLIYGDVVYFHSPTFCEVVTSLTPSEVLNL